MTPEREAELFAKMDLLLELMRRSDADIRELRHEVRDMRQVQQESNERLARVEGRIEEQSKFLQLVLAGRQPRKAAG